MANYLLRPSTLTVPLIISMIHPASLSIDPEIIELTSRVGAISVIPRYQFLP